MSNSETSNGIGRRGKVCRLIEEHDIEGVGDRLERRWTASGDERMSLRDLADEFNRELLRAVMSNAGMQHLDGDLENLYRLLTSDDVSSADRTRAERRLGREDVDVQRLKREFVTYQAVRTFLKDHRGVSYSADTEQQVQTEKEHIQRLRGRVLSVTDDKLTQLQRNGDINLGSFSTLVEVNVLCKDCGTQYDIETLLEDGGCDCDD